MTERDIDELLQRHRQWATPFSRPKMVCWSCETAYPCEIGMLARAVKQLYALIRPEGYDG
jgi:hypothetical protein